MRPQDIIRKKRDGAELSRDEIEFFVRGVTSGEVADYQSTALLMAIFLLDTTVIIDAINGKRGRDQILDDLLEQRNLLACCSINVTEVYAGTPRKPR